MAGGVVCNALRQVRPYSHTWTRPFESTTSDREGLRKSELTVKPVHLQGMCMDEPSPSSYRARKIKHNVVDVGMDLALQHDRPPPRDAPCLHYTAYIRPVCTPIADFGQCSPNG